MSLLTDLIFVKALRANATLMEALPAGDVYNTAIATPDEDLDNAPLPYVIVTFEGMQEDSETKDDSFSADSDRVNIGIEVAAETRPQLGELVTAIRSQIHDYFEANQGDDSDADFALIPNSTTLTAQGVNYDSMKPCYWQMLTYACDTDIDE